MSYNSISRADTILKGRAIHPGLGRPGYIGQLPVIKSYVPAAAVADGISASQSVGAGASALLNGSLTAGGAVEFNVPRNVVGAWTTNSIITVSGFDEYGKAMSETGASGATFASKKAFKRVTRITSSAAITAATFGTGDVLGLPVLTKTGGLCLVLLNGVSVDTATLVRGDTATATKTTGDVRGTFDPAGTINGTNAFVVIMLPDSDVTTAGCFGVPQA